MDWLLIAELHDAVASMERTHEWDMTSGETARYIEPIYEGIMTWGFPRDRIAWNRLFDQGAINTWGKDHKCDVLTDHEVWDFVSSLTDSLFDRNRTWGSRGPIDYIRRDLGCGPYPSEVTQTVERVALEWMCSYYGDADHSWRKNVIAAFKAGSEWQLTKDRAVVEELDTALAGALKEAIAKEPPADSSLVERLRAEIKQQRQWKYEIAADKNRLEKFVESFLREAGRGNLSHCNGQAAIDEMMAEAKKALKFCTSCDGSGKETEVSRPDSQKGDKA